jgi:hypothetical protein
MEKIVTDSIGNTITFNYDALTDSITVVNSAVGSESMNVIMNTSEASVGMDVIMIAEYLNYDNWSDIDVRNQLKNFWDENKVNK